MNKSKPGINLDNITSQLRGVLMPIVSHSAFIVSIISIGILIYAIYITSIIIGLSDDAAYREGQAGNKIIFDATTITKINELSVSTDKSDIQLPDGRRNPFVE